MAQTCHTMGKIMFPPETNCRFEIDEEDEAALSVIRSSLCEFLGNGGDDNLNSNLYTIQNDVNHFFEKDTISIGVPQSCPPSSSAMEYPLSVDLGPRCIRCGNPCGEDVIYHGNLAFHSCHFNCYECGAPLTVGISLNNEVFCQLCASTVKPQDTTCCICHSPKTSTSIVVEDRCFCRDHFMCAHCGKLLNIASFKRSNIDGNFYCEEHCPNETFLLCAGCKLPITVNSPMSDSKAISAYIGEKSLKFHSHCFNCNICHKSLVTPHKYTVYEEQPICLKCFKNLPKKVQSSIAGKS